MLVLFHFERYYLTHREWGEERFQQVKEWLLHATSQVVSERKYVAEGELVPSALWADLHTTLPHDPYPRWSTRQPQRPGMWFEPDLGRSQMIRGFRFDNAPSPNDYPRGYRVKVSTDRAHWTEVAANPDNKAPLDVTFPLREVRYIRVEQTGHSDRWWWSIHEIEIKV